jgi:periplasmic copper chaperone A
MVSSLNPIVSLPDLDLPMAARKSGPKIVIAPDFLARYCTLECIGERVLMPIKHPQGNRGCGAVMRDLAPRTGQSGRLPAFGIERLRPMAPHAINLERNPMARFVFDRRAPRAAFLLVFLAGSGLATAQAPAVDAPWARPTAPGAKVGGAFMTLVGGKDADRLLAGSSPAAAAVELHTHVMDGGVAKMRAVPAIEVPAGGRVELKPGGLHIMLINLKAPLKAGETVPLKLRFEKAGEVEVKVAVAAQAPGGQSGHAMHSPQHKH